MALTGIVIGGGAGGAGANSVGVPSVLDLPQAEAEAKLREFELVPRSSNVEAEGVEGTVFSQDPAPRTIRARGSLVSLLIIRAPVIPVNVGQQLADLKTAVDGLSTQVGGVSTQVDGVSTQVDGVSTKVDGVSTKVDGVSTKVDGVSTKVDGVTTSVNGVGTKVDAVSAKIDALGTALTAVGDSAAKAEADTAAETRKKAILDRIDGLKGKYEAAETPRKASPRAGT